MSKITLLEFFADWCSACKEQDPILTELERDIGNKVEVVRVGLSENKDMFDEFGIQATPTIILIKDDNVIKKYVGVTSKNELENEINKAYT